MPIIPVRTQGTDDGGWCASLIGRPRFADAANRLGVGDVYDIRRW